MDEQTKKLIAVGASVGANCHPCLEYHVGKALEFGIDRSKIMDAIEIAKAVRQGAASSMDKLALSLIQDRSPLPTLKTGECGCCS
ncbi:MAG: carboxymuconolactone decarboxylase family protein [Deltaproteobacteria bacterium]|nr:carboxymuconolactone decarboxylase family protein [Deltaproteobacteria bacterium]